MKPDDPLPDTRPFTLAAAFLWHSKLAQVETITDSAGYDQFGKVTPVKLRHWREDYYRFNCCSYQRIHVEELRPMVNAFLNTRRVFGHDNSVRPLRVSAATKRDVFDQLRDLTQADAGAMPCWLDGRLDPPPRDVLAFQNGLLDVKEWLRDDNVPLLPPTENWFSTSVSPSKYDPSAICPQWVKFLEKTLDDYELIETLQEWFGYCLTADTSLQKMLWLHGPGGAGKGTIMRTMRRVIGDANTVPFDLWALGDRFILSSFLGKRLAISGDANLGSDTDSRRVMARLNGISGEDPQGIDRKNRDLIDGIHLTTRFVISINQFPRMPESGNAMGRRAVLIPFKRSFTGSEDTQLDAKLAAETAGITIWALHGLRRLRERGQFTETTAGAELRQRFVGVMFPIKAFVDDCCNVGARLGVSVDDMYKAYCTWAKKNGHRTPSKPHFGESLHDAIAGLERVRARGENDRHYEYRGVELNSEMLTELYGI